MKKLIFVVAIFLLGVLIFLSGCTYTNNQPAKFVHCCNQSDKFYNCVLGKQENQPGVYKLSGNCGDYNSIKCSYYNSSSSEVLDDKYEVIKDLAGNPISPNQCSGICNFANANCTNEDKKNTCYDLDNKAITYPICVDDKPNPCIQNSCKILICGEKKATVKKSASIYIQDESKNYQKSTRSVFESPKGLVRKICEFRFMNASTARLASDAQWVVSPIKFGFLGSFSDYEIAKFYFPPSDFFCAVYSNAVVDRFTNYLNYSSSTSKLSKLDVFNQQGYKAPLHFCNKIKDKDGNEFYQCAADPSINFSSSGSSSSPINALFLCNFYCSKIYSCSNNLVLAKQEIEVNRSKQKVVHYNVNLSSYLSSLEKEYPAEAVDYYRKENEQGVGPAGAKVFECTSDQDCLSGVCNKALYFRSSCFSKSDGSSIACNCTEAKSCIDAFKCDLYPIGSIEHEQCLSNKFFCELFNGEESSAVVLCNFVPNTTDLYAYDINNKLYTLGDPKKSSYSVLGPNSANGDWGVYDFHEFNKYLDKKNPPPIEFANVMVKKSVYGCYNQSSDKIVDPICNNKDTLVDDPKNKGSKKCKDSNNNLYNPHCPSGTGISGDPQLYQFYIDNDELWNSIYLLNNINDKNNEMRWYWRNVFFLVPNKVIVSAKSNKIFFVTSRNTTFDDLKSRFPFIDKCKLSRSTLKDIIDGNGDPNADLIEVSIRDIPKINHSQIEKYLSPIVYGSVINEVYSDYYALLDKTWILNGFGECNFTEITQDDATLKRLLTKSYGICESCGSFISVAYQKVSDADRYTPAEYTQRSSLGATDPIMIYTDPDFTYLTNKIHSYLENNVMPILDLTNYSKNLNFPTSYQEQISFEIENMADVESLENLEKTYSCLDKLNCEQKEDSNGDGTLDKYICSCKVNLGKDGLLAYLQKDHQAVFLIVDYMDSPLEQISTRVNNVKALCPYCLVGLEYKPVISISSLTDLENLYGQTLNKSIYDLWEIKLPDKDLRGLPPENLSPKAGVQPPTTLQKIDFIVLNLNLSNINNPNEYDKTIKNSAEFSRLLLNHIGKPSIWKLRFNPSAPSTANSYKDPVFFDKLFQYQRNLSLSGLVAILMPSLFDKENISFKFETPYDPFFCSVQNGSLSFLNLDIQNDVTKLNSQQQPCNSNSCFPCSGNLCQKTCLDGTQCPEVQSGDQTCNSYCISDPYCSKNKCQEKFDTYNLTCLYVEKNSKYVESSKKVEFSNFNDVLSSPYAEQILASIQPPCCLNETKADGTENYYIYVSSPQISYNIETASYPFFGGNDTECSKNLERLEENKDQNTCGPVNLNPYSFSNRIYYCFWVPK